jgi:hypothetical protein
VTYLPLSDEIAVAELSNNRVSIFNAESGAFVRNFGHVIRANEAELTANAGAKTQFPFKEPCAVAADEWGHILVRDKGSSRLHVFSAEGGHLCTRDDLELQEDHAGLAWSSTDGGCLAIGNGNSNKAMVYGAF